MAPRNQEREAREARDRLRRYTARQTVHEHQQKRRRRDNIVAVIGVVVVAGLAAATQIFYFTAGPGVPTPVPSASADPSATTNVGDVPSPDLAEARTWTGTLAINDTVSLAVSLDGAAAPQAVATLVQSAASGYYTGKTCHRLLATETAGLIQCGSLDGTGATDTTFSFGPIENAPADGLYPAGTIAMARVPGEAYSNSRQFFIVTRDTTLSPDAVGGYSVVGTVTSGLEQLIANVVDGGIVQSTDPEDDPVTDGAPVVATTITGFTIQ